MIITTAYSDIDLHDPGSYYGGFKEARILRWGSAVHALSHPRTGEWRGSTFEFDISDYDLIFRQQQASPTERFWTEPLAVRMTDRPTRAALGVPFTVFVGPIVGARPIQPLGWNITLGDIVSQRLLSDEFQIPWRMIGDGFLHLLDSVSENLDRGHPEPIIYGRHVRLPSDPASPDGMVYQPTYLGTQLVSATAWHVWLVAGHACADIPNAYVNGVSILAGEGTDWLIPHQVGWTGEFGVPYRDLPSATYGTDRRYTLIYGLVGATDPDAVALGEATLTVAVEGVEPVGDGSGEVELDRLQQYKHFSINYLAHAGPDSYQSGAWLTNPYWSIYDGLVAIIDETSFDEASAIAEERLPAVGSPSPAYPAGYIGAAIIGATAGDRVSARSLVADWNRSCGVRSGVTNKGRWRVVPLHPTEAIKAAAPLFTDAYEILQGSFYPDLQWSEQANSIPFRTDYHHATGQWLTVDVAELPSSVAEYGRVILGERRDYPMAPGITMAFHLARLEAIANQHPPRMIRFDTPVDSGLATRNLGEYIRYQHFGAIATSPTQIRLGQIVQREIKVGERRASVDVLDCEDLIGYDEGLTGSPGDPGSPGSP